VCQTGTVLTTVTQAFDRTRSSGKVRASHVLVAMGASAEDAASAIRVSLGWASAPSDAERFIAAWSTLAARRAAARRKASPRLSRGCLRDGHGLTATLRTISGADAARGCCCESFWLLA
jgi:hypothetical protein